jgi:hypothetical protein
MSYEKIWYDDLSNFLTNVEIVPLHTMTFEAKINATVRFFIILGIILSLLMQDYRYILFGLIALTVSYPLYELEKRDKAVAETFLKKNDIEIIDNKACTRSSIENPFMNPSIVDNPEKPEACNSAIHESVKEEVDKNFSERVFKNVADIYGKDYSAREFYTVPNTSVPNKQGEFANWLYGRGATCKEGNAIQCISKNYRYTLR